MIISMALLMLDVIFICFPILHGSHLPKGLPPAYRGFYDPSNQFTCLDKSATIPFNWVNDDYCDCRDGSDEPGTAACPNTQFYCPNDGHKSEFVPSSFVNDMRCDCCDGSDEYLGYTNCTNTCGVLAREKEAAIIEKRKQIISGHETYKTYVTKKAVELEEQEKRKLEAERLRAEQEELDREKAEAEARDKAERGEPDSEESEDENDSLAEPPLPGTEDQDEIAEEVVESQAEKDGVLDLEPSTPVEGGLTEEEEQKETDQTTDEEKQDELPFVEPEERVEPPPKPIDYGPDNGFMMLTEPDVGCLELRQKEYIYSLCAFKSVYQRQLNDPAPGTLLGLWKEWKSHPMDSATWPKSMKMELPYDMMIYDGGSTCWSGPSRSVSVHVTCGPENRLTSAEEPSRCIYEMSLQTPAACHHHPDDLLAKHHSEL